MASRTRILGISIGLALAAGAFVGCESTDLSAPADALLTVTASPANAVIDEATERGRSTIFAKVVDAEGVPIESVVIAFNPSSGSLVDNRCRDGACELAGEDCASDADCPLPATGPLELETDETGRTSVPLVVTAADEENVVVAASSGALAGSATVFNALGRENDPPTASFAIFPTNPALNGGPIDLDATATTDPDGDSIRCYQWTINSSIDVEQTNVPCNPPSDLCDVIQGPGESLVTLNYQEEQRLSFQLRVSDDPDLDCPRSGPVVDRALLSPLIDSLSGYVVCNNLAPTAVPGSYGPVNLVGGTVDVQLDGSASSDPETPDSGLTFRWNCGGSSGQAPTGIQVVCTYTTPGLKTVTLTVIDPGVREAACSKNNVATTTIDVN